MFFVIIKHYCRPFITGRGLSNDRLVSGCNRWVEAGKYYEPRGKNFLELVILSIATVTQRKNAKKIDKSIARKCNRE